MAQMSKCCNCECFDFKNGKCSYYAGSIPKEIFSEVVSCENYSLHKDNENDNRLPVAKGR